MDSALLVFSYIGDSFEECLSDDDRKLALLAKNNVGIIYAFEYMDYPRGYEILAEAFDKANAPGFEATQAVVAHNIVELLRLYSVCLRSENVKDRIEEYTSIGVKKAMYGKEYTCLASMVINCTQYNLGHHIEALSAIYNKEIPDSVEGLAYARDLLHASRLFQHGSIPEARKVLNEAFTKRPGYANPWQYVVGHKHTLATTYAAQKNYEEAERIALEALSIADSIGSVNYRLMMLAFLSELKVPNKDIYADRLIQLKDSAISNGQLQMVSEIDFIQSLSKEREANRMLVTQRIRLYWGLGIGGFLLVVFGVLTWLLVRNTRRLKERNAALYSKIQEQLKMSEATSYKGPSDSKSTANFTSKYAGSSLSQEKMDELKERISELLNNEEWVCDSEISLTRAANDLGINTSYLSRAINERFGMSFSSLLNEYRISIATRRMSNGSKFATQTIESIAYSVGYSSRSSFITAFKKINGMTPSEYMKCQAQAQNKN